MDLKMVKERYYIKMVHFMKVIGFKIRGMAKVEKFIKMEITMKKKQVKKIKLIHKIKKKQIGIVYFLRIVLRFIYLLLLL